MNEAIEIADLGADFFASLRPDRKRKPFEVVQGVIRADRTFVPLTADRGGVADGIFAGLHVDGDCPERCRAGFTYYVDAEGYDRSVPCTRCQPVYQHARRFNAARLPVWAHRVERDWSGDMPWHAVETLATDLAAGREQARVWYGDPGRGKSFRACGIALKCIALGVQTAWVTWPDLLSSLKDQMRDDKPLRTLLDPLTRVGLLVVDEVKGSATPFSSEVAELLIGRRCELGRRVLITANLSKDQLWACLGDRVQSRVTQAGLTQNITGKDRRAREAA